MKILVIQPGSLGDVMLSLPALKALGGCDAGACLEMIGRPSVLRLLEASGDADAVISIDRADVTECLTGRADPAAPLARRLAVFDLAVDWLAMPQSGAALRALGIRRVITARPVSQTIDRRHRIEVYLDSLGPLRIAPNGSDPKLDPARQDAARGRDILRGIGIETGPGGSGALPVLAIHPGSGSPRNRWALDRFIDLSRRIRHRLPVRPVFILGPAERDLAPALGRAAPEAGVLDSLPLEDLAGVLCAAGLYLGNDSGVTHLAAALGLPTVAIFGPTDPGLWAPRSPRVRILSKRLAGADSADADLPEGGLRLLSAEEVLKAVCALGPIQKV